MSQPARNREDRSTGRGSPASDGRLMLLDDRQWSYLRQRYGLTPREQQIAELVCQGLRTGHIAGCLRIQPGTVKTHVRNIYRKVRVKSRINMLLRFVAEAKESSAGFESTQSAPALD